jgi:hypothetical protein
VGFEVLTAMVMMSSTFWDIMPYSPSKVNSIFGGICSLQLQDQIISQERSQHEEGSKHGSFLLHLFIDFENGGDKFLRNVG